LLTDASGLKLIGFSIWERRSYALLRPIGDVTSQDHLRELILEAYAAFEERAAIASEPLWSGAVRLSAESPRFVRTSGRIVRRTVDLADINSSGA
jgi:hypothetical protein